RRDIAEHPRAEVRVAEDEAAEIAGECLDANAHRGCIEERRTPALAAFAAQEREHPGRVAEPPFEERVLDGAEIVHARFSRARVHTDNAVFLRLQVIDVGDAFDLEPPVYRLERGVAFEHVHRDDGVLTERLLPPAAEKFQTAWTSGAHSLGGGKLAEVEEAFARDSEVHENVVADDRVIAFQDVLVKRVEDAALAEARVFRNAFAPTVLDNNEVGVFRSRPLIAVRAGRAERFVLGKPNLRPVVWILTGLLGLLLWRGLLSG